MRSNFSILFWVGFFSFWSQPSLAQNTVSYDQPQLVGTWFLQTPSNEVPIPSSLTIQSAKLFITKATKEKPVTYRLRLVIPELSISNREAFSAFNMDNHVKAIIDLELKEYDGSLEIAWTKEKADVTANVVFGFEESKLKAGRSKKSWTFSYQKSKN